MSWGLTEIERRLANIVRVGTVESLEGARVTVSIGGVTTAALPWLTQRAGPDSTWWAPEPGEQVIVLSPSGDLAQGIVLPSLYQTAHPPPGDRESLHRTVYEDGTTVEYDRAASHMTVDCVGAVTVKGANALLVDFGGTVDVKAGDTATIEAPKVILKTPLTECTEQLLVKGPLIAQAGMAVSGTAATGGGSTMSIEGELNMGVGDILFDGLKSYRSHDHDENDNGGPTDPAN